MLRTFLRDVRGNEAVESDPSPGDVTLLLRRLETGDLHARGELVSAMYPELKRIAEARMRGERFDHTLQPTALVNEFFLEIARTEGMNWRNRKHFLAVASQVMRRFLIDYGRSHSADRRGGSVIRVRLADLELQGDGDGTLDAIIVSDLLDRLAAEEPRMAQVVEMRCFGGLSHAEIADILNVDERTVKRDWKIARAWLYGHLQK
jgi:RNA polymerase sigma factor (TIGR02999 family)